MKVSGRFKTFKNSLAEKMGKFILQRGELLRWFYEKHRITQAEEAKKIGVSRSQVSNALSGKNDNVLNKLVEVFIESPQGKQEGVSYKDFFPMESNIEQRLETLEENQKIILSILKEIQRG